MAHLTPGAFELTQANHDQIVKNLLKRTRQFHKNTVQLGMEWYPSAQKDAKVIGEDNTQAGAAAISRLSGTRDYQRNRQMGLQLMSMDSGDIANLIASKDKSEEERKAIRTQILSGTPLNDQTSDNIIRAHNARTGLVEPASIFNRSKRGSNKLPDFFVSVGSGGTDPTHFPIDTHAYDAALDNYHITYGVGNKHMKVAGVYPFLQSAYLAAHQKAIRQGLISKDTTPAQFQAIHWVHHQLGKAQVNSRSNTRMVQSSTQARATADKFPNLDPATRGLDPIPTVEELQTRLGHFSTGISEGR